MAKISSSEAGTFFLAVVVISVATSPLSFTLGAYGEIFYREMMIVWVVSIAALIAGVTIGETEEGERFLSWWGAILLILPSFLMFAQFMGIKQDSILIDIADWGVLLATVPYVGYILLSVTTPEAMELRTPKLIAALIACFVTVNAFSFGVGAHNSYFMTCDDFTRAGDQAPLGCWVPPDFAESGEAMAE